MSRGRRASFVVRVVQRRRGEVSGVIEQVATGAKEAFSEVEAIGLAIMGMLQGERPVSKRDPRSIDVPQRGSRRPSGLANGTARRST
jgi:hypothetical protein